MIRWTHAIAGLAAAVLATTGSTSAQTLKDPIPYPMPQSLQKGEATRIRHGDLMKLGTLPEYHEPDWVTELVKAGKLPPVKERLPEQPIIVDTASVGGAGSYGGVLRHVSGARPQGWNWMAGQNFGWGGLEEAQIPCLVRTGPMWMLTKDKVEPLPQLATSWDWSEDGKQLTMNLLKGAKWSDGQPFSADDVMFMWDDNLSDPNVPAWVRPGAYGEATTLEKIDDATIRWTFKEAFPVSVLLQMSHFKLCPGPAHILKPLHPKYNKEATYDSYINALKPEKTPWVTMGPWTAVDYKPDQIIVLRRNPYYFAVDEKGNQLPYLDEIQYKLSTWEDRTIQTVAGSADYTNMEDPSIYLESLRRAQDPSFPNSIFWGPRSLSWRIDFNLSTTCGVENERDLAIRDLNRKLDFRRAVTQAVDRVALGQSLVRGPFLAPHAGGLNLETDFGTPEMVTYYPYDLPSAKTLLDRVGFKDTDKDGIVNWPDGPLAGQNLEVALGYTTLYTTTAALAESLVTMAREAGIRLILRPTSQLIKTVVDTCKWDWVIQRGDRYYHVPVGNLDHLAPLTPTAPEWHKGTMQKPQETLDFEKELVALARKIGSARETEARNQLLREYNKVFTKNVYHVGLVSVPAALIINKRFRNVPKSTPVLAYQWGEDGVMRERLWVDPAAQGTVPELAPKTLPGIR